MEFKDFLIRQPGYPEECEQDRFYFSLALSLESSLTSAAHDILSSGLSGRLALSLTDYLQDIVADGGLWRGFVDANRKLYGFSVPFHPNPEEYVDYELNREDVRFLVWYVIAMLDENRRDINPHDEGLLRLADYAYEELEKVYDDAPVSDNWHITRGLEMHDPEDRDTIIRLTEWLFNRSYLLTPAFATDLQEIMGQIDPEDEDVAVKLRDKLDEALMELPTGPLALFAFEWTALLIQGKLPAQEEKLSNDKVHPYYEAFVKTTGGEPIKFFGSYDEMNRFFIDALGWEKGKNHLDMMKGAEDYVLLVNKHKGMLMARDVAKCIASPSNPYYDASYARTHAFGLLTVRGLCPADLYHYIVREGWFPETSFPGSEDISLVSENRDFIARCYLQQYYRGD